MRSLQKIYSLQSKKINLIRSKINKTLDAIYQVKFKINDIKNTEFNNRRELLSNQENQKNISYFKMNLNIEFSQALKHQIYLLESKISTLNINLNNLKQELKLNKIKKDQIEHLDNKNQSKIKRLIYKKNYF